MAENYPMRTVRVKAYTSVTTTAPFFAPSALIGLFEIGNTDSNRCHIKGSQRRLYCKGHTNAHRCF